MTPPNRRDRWKVIYDGLFPAWSERRRISAYADGVTHVYAIFDINNECLYVGTSTHWASRFDSHRTNANWWPDAERLVLIEVHGSKRDAQKLWRAGYDVEQQLMEDLRPICNIVVPWKAGA